MLSKAFQIVIFFEYSFAYTEDSNYV